MSFGPQTCGDLDAGTTREWLVADGCGGYAMGTVSGLRTRRYHALHVLSGAEPAARTVVLVALDPVIKLINPTANAGRTALGTHEWADGTIHPAGHRLLERFDLTDGLPRWRWRIGDVVLERELATARGTPTLGVVFRLVAASAPVEVTVDAIITWRDAHGERTAGGGDPVVAHTPDGCVIERAYRLAGPAWTPAGGWWRRVYHREEAARGLPAEEDLWHAGRFTATLHPHETLQITGWAGDLGTRPAPPVTLVREARARSREIVARAAPADENTAALVRAADAFVIAGPNGPDVVAGYPWFGTWSRDTMISYAGLFLATARADEGRELLRGYAATLSEGMLANTADTGRTEYNTVDATLWFLHAVDRHVAATGDTDLAAELLPGLLGVVDAHVTGTRFGIRLDPADALITQGAPGHALTWMDARVDGVPVTPRHGKPVEVNALWINGLGALATLCGAVGREHSNLERLRSRAMSGFARRYPVPGAPRLHDVLDGPAGNDPALRPNQVLAYSLPYPALVPDPAVLATVAANLLTPLGLRSLAPQDPAYESLHRGAPAARDTAYHRGTVWPWLLGPYLDALSQADGSEASHKRIESALTGIDAHLMEWGLGSVSETADGQAPHRATGCPFQAWSVAEPLRVRRG